MFFDNKMAVTSSCSVDEAIQEPFVFSKCGKEKTKELYRFRKGVLGVLPTGFGKSLIW